MGTFFSFIASIIAWAGSCKKIPETFTVLYRVQATFATLGMITAMGALGWDIYVLCYDGYELHRYCDDIFYIWITEVVVVFIVWINTMVASAVSVVAASLAVRVTRLVRSTQSTQMRLRIVPLKVL